MGYESDSLTLASALACTSVATPGTLTPGTATFGGSDFTRGVLRVKFTAITTAPTSMYLLLQSTDGTDWYPNITSANLVTALTAKDPNNPVVIGAAVPLAASPATSDRYAVPFTGCPGATFRVAVLAIGASGAFTVTITGDFQKFVPDNT